MYTVYVAGFLYDVKEFRGGGSANRSFYLAPATKEEIERIIQQLPNKNSSGIDGISPKTMKAILPAIKTEITELINLSITEKTFPENAKVGKTTPLYKGGKKELLTNYRPITNTSTIAKIIEKYIQKQLNKFLEQEKFFYKKQHGFRSNTSTKIAATEVINEVQEHLDKGGKAAIAFLDLQKAFDLVNHNELLKSLEAAGIRGHTLE
ncbi:uncharacterized protein LOC108737538 isoform X2 [Agrilus planipennis]|uniref:Uncharacterized protein LOC108737538 isoform X2 n=1 Tax=Agrilus planipennis TaxID=224129 RepID=A0A7F5R618_AGRPL|nr:uncharacterized protein LOC108737538 isoform X2 [Agrilus planipennis]